MVIYPLKMVIYPLKMVIFNSYVRKTALKLKPAGEFPPSLDRLHLWAAEA